jgi:tetratricopeptide (TPR) repeat protein
MLERYPERWEPLYLKGTCLAMEGKQDQAIPLLNQVIAAEPSPEAYLNLATAHQALFHLEEWVTCLKKVVDLDGEAGQCGHRAKVYIDEFYGNLGLAYAGQGERDRAIACLDKAIELDADYQPAIYNRRILLASPDEQQEVQSMREIDFYGDRARAGGRRPASARAFAR